MMNQRCVVAVDSDGSIVQRGQQILLDIADLRCVLLEAGNHELDMMGVQLQKPGTDNLCRVVAASHSDILLGGANGVHENFQYFCQLFTVIVPISKGKI